jgi:signal transduction histidine kinase
MKSKASTLEPAMFGPQRAIAGHARATSGHTRGGSHGSGSHPAFSPDLANKTIVFGGRASRSGPTTRADHVRLEERQRIAQELHDTLLQTFMSASLHLGAALYEFDSECPIRTRLTRTLEIMRQGIEEGRNAIHCLRSPGTPPRNLAAALSRVPEETGAGPGVDFRLTVTGRPVRLPAPVEHDVYRIGKEALLNALHHSGAELVELRLEYSGAGLQMRIRDNGRGIDAHLLEKGCDGHWGLAGMRERAVRIGGQLKILSGPAGGAEVHLLMPALKAQVARLSALDKLSPSTRVRQPLESGHQKLARRHAP